MVYNIHPINLIRALSLALELSTGGLSRHHWRTAMIANRIAEQIQLEPLQRQILVYAALLHDLGAASNWTEKRKIQGLEYSRELCRHAEAGYQLLKGSVQFGILAEPIRYHHECWDGSGAAELAGKKIPLLSRIINIADRVEILLRDGQPIFEQRPIILAAIRNYSGTYFDPELVRALHDFSQQESFWLDLTNPQYFQNFFRNMDAYGRIRLTIDDVVNIAEIFATIIDNTSRFTASHSRTVSIAAEYLARQKGYSTEEVKTMRIAGLLHDLGKLSIPKAILEKPDKLTEREFAIIKQHTYYTYRILEQIDGFEVIAEWAAFHHETLDGTGYPFRVKEESLKLGSRIVAVADVFAALTENRPYRTLLEASQVEKIMRSMVSNRRLDGKIVADLFSNGLEPYSLVQMANKHFSLASA
ncbi:MAG: HD domain-containing phosphohydrolase [Veillonellales bacterium]